jgi:hypothetical protein
MASSSHPDSSSLRHVIVCAAGGRFNGWPANTGIWSWGNEIAVGFAQGAFARKENDHSIDRDQPLSILLGRSRDGGETWTVEPHPELDGRAPGAAVADPIDFAHPDFTFRAWHRSFWYSHDRGRTWQGPFDLGDLGLPGKLTARTDYLVTNRHEALFFMAAEVEGVQAGRYKDRAFCARTSDGGQTFQFVSWINGQPAAVRAVMPATVRLSSTELVTVLRRRFDVAPTAGNDHCWLDAFGSKDNGASWQYLSRVAYTDLGRHNGNPASLVRLPSGDLCVTYGFRAPPHGMRAKLSADGGRSWGPEISLRADALTWDFGYPRSVVRPDGKVVVVYYFNTAQRPEQHIAATIWDPRA